MASVETRPMRATTATSMCGAAKDGCCNATRVRVAAGGLAILGADHGRHDPAGIRWLRPIGRESAHGDHRILRRFGIEALAALSPTTFSSRKLNWRMHYRFGSFIVSPATRLLQRESVQLNVSRKLFDCLAYLIEHRDRAVGRDELARALWKHDNVSDNQLAQVVAAVRRLVDDDGSLQRLVRTVPGFGYHWIGTVEIVEAIDIEPGDGVAAIAPDVGTAVVSAQPVPATPDEALIPARSLSTPIRAAAPVQPTLPAASPAKPPARQHTHRAALVLLVLALLVLVGIRLRGPVEDASTARQPAAATSPAQAWVLPAVLPDDSEAWARIGLMAMVGEGLRRTGAVVTPVEKVPARISEPVPNERLPMLLSELDAALVVAPRVHRLDEAWVVELIAASKTGDSVRVDANASDLTAAARAAVSRLNRRLQRSGAELDGSIEETFGVIEQAIRARDFEGALLQLSRLPADAREMPETGILEIRLKLEKGRYLAARDEADLWLGRLDRVARPGPFARTLLLKVNAMRQLNEPSWAPLVDEALGLLKGTDAPRDLAVATQLRGIAAIIDGRPTDAAKDLSRAREMFVAIGDELKAAAVAGTMAQMAVLQGRHLEALTLLEQSRQVMSAYGAVGPLIQNSLWTGYVFSALSRWNDVLHVTEQMQSLLQAGGGASGYEQFTYLRLRVHALMELGRLKEAEALLDEQVHQVQRELSDNPASDGGPLNQVTIAAQRARLRIMQGRWQEAGAAASDGLKLMSRAGENGGSFVGANVAEALLLLLVRAQAGDLPWSPRAPLPNLTQSQIEALQKVESPDGFLARAYWNARSGNIEEAEADYLAALAMEYTQRSPNVTLIVMEAYIQFLLSRGRIEDASRQLDQLEAQAPGAVERDYDTALLRLRVRLAEGGNEHAQVAARRVLALIGERPPPADVRPILESGQRMAIE